MAYTLEQANEIIEDFEDLVGTEIVMGNRDTEIQYITTAPAGLDSGSYISFAGEYHASSAGGTNIYENQDNEHEIIVIIGQPGSFTVKTIRDYVHEAGIGYNFPS